MSDLTITAGNVAAGSNAQVDFARKAGETITAGQAVYRSSSTGLWMKADNNAVAAEVRQATGIALNGAASGQPLAVQTGGDITIGATVAAGAAYYLSDTAGGICPLADVGAGEYICLIGVAKSTSVIQLIFAYTGAQGS